MDIIIKIRASLSRVRTLAPEVTDVMRGIWAQVYKQCGAEAEAAVDWPPARGCLELANPKGPGKASSLISWPLHWCLRQ